VAKGSTKIDGVNVQPTRSIQVKDHLRSHQQKFNRRQLFQSAAIGAGCVLVGKRSLADAPAPRALPPVAVFSKLYQQLKLDFEQSAEVTSDAGLDGIDSAVRAGGEILPEHAVDEMPRYAEALAKHGAKMLLLTTDIVGVDSPHARDVLTTGKKLGIRYYRLGFWPQRPDTAPEKQTAQIQASLKELAAMNRELGVCAVLENHSVIGSKVGDKSATTGRGYAGGDLNQLYEIVNDFDPEQIAVAFDIGHAIIMHGDDWHQHFERLRDHIRIVYLKDVKQSERFVALGEGEVGKTDFIQLLVKMDYRAPLSIHIEYPWAPEGQKTRAAMVETLKNSRRVLADWWQRA
jgi:sugar phosphate isomerase/epimerase